MNKFYTVWTPWAHCFHTNRHNLKITFQLLILCQFGLLCPFCHFSKVIRGDLKMTWGKGVATCKVPHHALSHSPRKNCHSIWPFSICARYTLWLQNRRNKCRLQCFPYQVVYMKMSGESSRTLPTAETMDSSGFYLSAANTFTRLAQR